MKLWWQCHSSSGMTNAVPTSQEVMKKVADRGQSRGGIWEEGQHEIEERTMAWAQPEQRHVASRAYEETSGEEAVLEAVTEEK